MHSKRPERRIAAIASAGFDKGRGTVVSQDIPAPLPGRPFYVSVQGAKIYISVHDAFHLKREREFKRQIRLAHPDRNHHRWACSRTRHLLKARRQFEAEEARWYARYGLEPPHGAVRLVGGGFVRSGPPLPLPGERGVPAGLVLEKACAARHEPRAQPGSSQAWPEAA